MVKTFGEETTQNTTLKISGKNFQKNREKLRNLGQFNWI